VRFEPRRPEGLGRIICIKVTIEDGQANLRSDNFYSVAYWHQKERHAAFPPRLPVEERIPKFKATGGPGQDANMK